MLSPGIKPEKDAPWPSRGLHSRGETRPRHPTSGRWVSLMYTVEAFTGCCRRMSIHVTPHSAEEETEAQASSDSTKVTELIQRSSDPASVQSCLFPRSWLPCCDGYTLSPEALPYSLCYPVTSSSSDSVHLCDSDVPIPSWIAFVPPPCGMCWESPWQHCPASLRAVGCGVCRRNAHAWGDPHSKLTLTLCISLPSWRGAQGFRSVSCSLQMSPPGSGADQALRRRCVLRPLPPWKSLVWPFCPRRDSISAAIVEMDQAKSNLIFLGKEIEFSTL